MTTQQQPLSSNVLDTVNPYGALGVARTATVDEGEWAYLLYRLLPSVYPRYVTVRRSYKQKVLETHPDKLPPTASEEEKNSAQELFRQVMPPAPPLRIRSHTDVPTRSKRRSKF